MPAEELDFELEVVVNGASLRMAPFVQQIIAATLTGLIGTLKGAENPREIQVRLRRKG